ncbi:hypothetical protein [Hespellia stercorisuis]|uniref:Uncharacterized protein n=1 Tax=Hespellia stercorisuis DSM 15480 TaxID=1121950 RepID=A0A1M6VFG4_9FIRM|nr:hypothetical protein [Hespellia stercorisuis]SHK80277.1 hypothetical protein SAMN02745243_03755 [Hespellia stercorisuis DSM 15480]
MKWKENVRIEWDEECRLYFDEKSIEIKPEWEYLVKALESGMTDDEMLRQLVMEQEQCDEVSAGFTLAQFVLDYGTFLEENREHMMITN